MLNAYVRFNIPKELHCSQTIRDLRESGESCTVQASVSAPRTAIRVAWGMGAAATSVLGDFLPSPIHGCMVLSDPMTLIHR
jgi:hypothetical protein